MNVDVNDDASNDTDTSMHIDNTTSAQNLGTLHVENLPYIALDIKKIQSSL